MSVLSWPVGLRNPNSISGPGLVANTQSGGISPFTGTEQTLRLPGARWKAELRWNNLPAHQARVFEAYIASLGGKAGRFVWTPTTFRPKVGSAGGTPVVSSAGQTGSVINTTNWTAGIIKTGDWIGWTDPTGRTALHLVTADATVVNGAAALSISPPIRRSPAAGAVINYENPSPVWRLSDDTVIPDHSAGPFTSITLTIEEALW